MKKKIEALACIMTILVTFAACKGQASSSAVSGGESQVVSSSGVSSTVSGSSSVSTPSSAPSSAASTAPANTTPKAAPSPKATTNKNSGNYQVKDADYSYNKENNAYKATYPQLSGDISNLDKVNAALKTSAMQTINSLGTAKKAAKTSVRVSGDVTYAGKNFISVGFNEYTSKSPKEKAVRTLRTVNINLKTGAVVAASDLVTQNDAFFKALEKAAKEQNHSDMTAAQIKSGIDSKVIYFTDSGVGFSVLNAGKEKTLVTVTLTYEETKPFVTKNAVWNNFI